MCTKVVACYIGGRTSTSTLSSKPCTTSLMQMQMFQSNSMLLPK